jgi:hypothetical protein
VAVHLLSEQWITSFATWMYAKEREKKHERIILNIPAIKFSPGTYKIYLSMTLHAAGVYIDRIENAAVFNIESADIFNSGREFTSDCGIVIPEGELMLV